VEDSVLLLMGLRIFWQLSMPVTGVQLRTCFSPLLFLEEICRQIFYGFHPLLEGHARIGEYFVHVLCYFCIIIADANTARTELRVSNV
jgi:hypothetical protein